MLRRHHDGVASWSQSKPASRHCQGILGPRVMAYTYAVAALLEVRNLSVTFDTPRGPVPAVRDLSFSLDAGEILGLAGEIACGENPARPGLFSTLYTSAPSSRGNTLS